MNPEVLHWLGQRTSALNVIFSTDVVDEVKVAAQEVEHVEDLPYYALIDIAYEAFRHHYIDHTRYNVVRRNGD
jgi:hypothetical protein